MARPNPAIAQRKSDPHSTQTIVLGRVVAPRASLVVTSTFFGIARSSACVRPPASAGASSRETRPLFRPAPFHSSNRVACLPHSPARKRDSFLGLAFGRSQRASIPDLSPGASPRRGFLSCQPPQSSGGRRLRFGAPFILANAASPSASGRCFHSRLTLFLLWRVAAVTW
jgi:hypothetical protein